MRIGRTSSIVVVLAVFLLLSSTQNVFAGLIDQKQESTGPWNSTIKSFEPIGQEFKPTLPILEAVEVNIITTANLGGDDTITLTIREGTIGGTVIATASNLVTQGFNGWLYFALTPVSVLPESTYVIRLEVTKLTFGWQYYPSDLYMRGDAIEGGVSKSGQDFTFRTYGNQQQSAPSGPQHIGGEVFSANKLAVLSPFLALIGLAGVVASAAFAFKRRRI